jgi:hypothetical protein
VQHIFMKWELVHLQGGLLAPLMLSCIVLARSIMLLLALLLLLLLHCRWAWMASTPPVGPTAAWCVAVRSITCATGGGPQHLLVSSHSSCHMHDVSSRHSCCGIYAQV